MISCALQGAMGNCMFQIGAIYSLALQNKTECGFDLRSYTPLQGFKANKYADNIFKKVPRLPENYQLKYSYTEPEFTYRALPFRDECLYKGYLQSTRYWPPFEKEVKELFDVSPITEFDCSNLTAVHVRRGDYLNIPDILPVLPKDYYDLCIQKIGGRFIFLSDDANWVRENFVGDNIQYSPFDNEVDDFRLLVSCKNVIAANSSFSLMGGILNSNNGVKICPGGYKYRWFGNSGPDSRDIAPENWIKV